MDARFAISTTALFLIQASLIVSSDNALGNCGRTQVDVIFVLDESGSIWGPDFTKQLKFVDNLVDQFDISQNGTWVGIETFGTDVRTIVYLGEITNAESLKRYISGISQRRGSTATHLALKRLREMFASRHSRQGVSRVAIVITDGESDMPKLTAVEADEVHNDGIDVFAIGVGQSVNREELERIASRSDYVFTVNNYDDLNSLLSILTIKACPESVKETTVSTERTPPPSRPPPPTPPPSPSPSTPPSTTTWKGAAAERTEEWMKWTTRKATTEPPFTWPAKPTVTFSPQILPKVFEGCGDSLIFNLYFGIPDQLSALDAYLALQFIRHVSILLRGTRSLIRPYLVPQICLAPTTYADSVDPSNHIDFLAALDGRWSKTVTRSDLQMQFILSQEESYRVRYPYDDDGFRSSIAILMLDNRLTGIGRMLKEIEYARRGGIQIVTIGVGDYVDRNELLQIATSERDVIVIRSYNYLPLICENLLERICIRGLVHSAQGFFK